MRIHPPSIPTKFHPDPSTNDGGVAIFTSVHKNNYKLLISQLAHTKSQIRLTALICVLP